MVNQLQRRRNTTRRRRPTIRRPIPFRIFNIDGNLALTSDPQGIVYLHVMSQMAALRASAVLPSILAQYAQFRPIFIKVSIRLNQQLNTSETTGNVMVYHYNQGENAPGNLTYLQQRHIINDTIIRHNYTGFARRWYPGSAFEGGLVIRAEGRARNATIGAVTVTLQLHAQ